MHALDAKSVLAPIELSLLNRPSIFAHTRPATSRIDDLSAGP